MLKNQTRFKSLDVINGDPRITSAHIEGPLKDEGIWVWLEHGFTADPYGAHDIHEYTVGACLDAIRRIRPCEADCPCQQKGGAK